MTLTDMVVGVLKTNEQKKFTSKELAQSVVSLYKTELSPRRDFALDEDFINQIQAEIGSHKKLIKKKKNVIIEEQTRPKLYFYSEDYNVENETIIHAVENEKNIDITEKELYPILATYLNIEFGIYSKRIDEQKSKNDRGQNGNKWLHPDLVGMQILDKSWDNIVSDCVRGSGGNRVKLFSYEVKKILTPSNLRESFFQSVSNSSWANYGFLVAAEIKGDIFEELRMLSSLHNIGFILLDVNNPSESQILLQANEKKIVDWESVNRLLDQNPDFYDFIQAIKVYYESGIVNKNDWYKLSA